MYEQVNSNLLSKFSASLALVIVILVFSWLVPCAAKATADWKPVLIEKKLTCSAANPCTFKQEKTGDTYEVVFDLTIEPEEKLRSITKITIKNVTKGGAQSFQPKEVARVFNDEPFEFYEIDLRNEGHVDFALLSQTSPHNGDLFYYFIFNPKTGKFEMTDSLVPKLEPSTDAKGAYIGVENKAISYELSDSFKLKMRRPAGKASPPMKQSAPQK